MQEGDKGLRGVGAGVVPGWAGAAAAERGGKGQICCAGARAHISNFSPHRICRPPHRICAEPMIKSENVLCSLATKNVPEPFHSEKLKGI
jgi:hypothetical protein